MIFIESQRSPASAQRPGDTSADAADELTHLEFHLVDRHQLALGQEGRLVGPLQRRDGFDNAVQLAGDVQELGRRPDAVVGTPGGDRGGLLFTVVQDAEPLGLEVDKKTVNVGGIPGLLEDAFAKLQERRHRPAGLFTVLGGQRAFYQMDEGL